MISVEDIEKAIIGLPAGQLAEFRAWFEAFDAAVFDITLEQDINAGKLDQLAETALVDFKEGRARNI